MSALSSLGIYVHVPVCETLCGYCDFYSIKQTDIADITDITGINGNNGNNGDFWPAYEKKILEELRYKLENVPGNVAVNSIYFGGGTPSLAPVSFMDNVINVVFKSTRVSRRVEISIEANPETLTGSLVDQLHAAGVNRISLGVQSLNDGLLKLLGRRGDRKTILAALEILARGPIANFSGDVIYGIPGQKEPDILETLGALIDHGAKHISAYALTMANNVLPVPGPVLMQAGAGEVADKPARATGTKPETYKTISEARQYAHQKLIWSYLPTNGFGQYEVSNFARKGYACLHNVAVWKYRPYLSLGTSGHSFLGQTRYRTVANVKTYLAQPLENSIITESAKTVPDLFITALRLKTRHGHALFRKLLGEDQYLAWQKTLEVFCKNGWVKKDNSGFEITTEGLQYSNTMVEMAYENLTRQGREKNL